MEKTRLSFYFDEDVSVKIASNLQNRGFDILTTLEAKNLGTTDEKQLEFSAKVERVFVTHNIKHFIALHSKYLSQGKSHYGIVVAVRQQDPQRLVLNLLNLIQHTSPQGVRGQLLYL